MLLNLWISRKRNIKEGKDNLKFEMTKTIMQEKEKNKMFGLFSKVALV